MQSYVLKTADGKKMYRIVYTETPVDGAGDAFVVDSCHITGVGVTLPSGLVVTALDERVDPTQVLVDQILGRLVAGSLAEYKALAVTVLGLDW